MNISKTLLSTHLKLNSRSRVNFLRINWGKYIINPIIFRFLFIIFGWKLNSILLQVMFKELFECSITKKITSFNIPWLLKTLFKIYSLPFNWFLCWSMFNLALIETFENTQLSIRLNLSKACCILLISSSLTSLSFSDPNEDKSRAMNKFKTFFYK